MERTYRILPVSKNQESRLVAPPVPDIYRTILSIWTVCFICVSFAKSVERNTFCHLLLTRYNCSWHNDALPAAPLLPLYSVLQTVTQISNGRSWERNPCEEKGHFVSSKLCDAMWTNMTVMTMMKFIVPKPSSSTWIIPVVPNLVLNDYEGTDILVSVVIKILSGSVHISWAWLTGEMISDTLLKQTEVEGGEGHSSQL